MNKLLNTISNNITLPVKMLVIGLLAVVSLAIPTSYFYNSSVGYEGMARAELAGIEYLNEALLLSKYIAEHRGTSAQFYGGNESAKVLRIEKSNLVDNYFEILRTKFDAAELDQFSLELRSMKRTWDSLKSNVASQAINASTSFATHSALITTNSELIDHLTRHFQLAYDPSPASYHKIMANFVGLPRLTDSLGKVRGLGAGILAKGEVSPKERAILEGFLNNVSYPAQDFIANLTASAEADPRFNSYSSDANDFSQRMRALAQLTSAEILEADNINYSSNLFFDEYTNLINDIYEFNGSSVLLLEQVLNERLEGIQRDRQTGLTVILIAMVFCFAFAGFLVRAILKGASSLNHRFTEIANGDYTHIQTQKGKDEFVILSNKLSSLTEHLAQAEVKAGEAHRVKQALDNSSTAFLMTDANLTITYANEAANDLLRKNEQDIKRDLQHFSVSELVGQNIDVFHKAPTHQRNILENLTSEHITTIKLGKMDLRLIINPIFDENQAISGFSTEFHDMTDVFEEERKTRRILESLNCTSTNVMIADANRDIIYLNASVKRMLQECESEIQKDLPQFKADNVLGNSMDIFHHNPHVQKTLLSKIQNVHTANIQIGDRYFRLMANPILSDSGERLGTVVEWLDRTKEVIAEQEIQSMVNAALEGDFTFRVKTDNKNGFLLSMAQGLNSLAEVTDAGLKDVSTVLMAISEGDLTQRIDNQYHGTFNDLKESCNRSSDNLASMVKSIRTAAETINMASGEIAQGNMDLSARTEEQASSLEQTAASMDQITGTVRQNAKNAEKANELAADAVEIAKQGGDLISQAVNAMADINDSAERIENIISVIDSLAFQTNILALNAAVEAARAGEQGRGFAVVASEVRTLAQRSAEAAKDIKQLISVSVNRVADGNSLVHNSGQTMDEIVKSIQRVNDIMGEIAAASSEQAISIDEISNTVTQMDDMTQQNAALVEEAAASSESLRAQSDKLTQSVFSFKLSDIANHPSQPLDLMQRTREETKLTPSKKTNASSIKLDDDWESF